ncbi:MAG: zinc ribbon domain-containing protein [Methanobacteriaceae archaeon]|nr:zinc ribbon domain-containing protein [Methanobacteriaceae archaeon]
MAFCSRCSTKNDADAKFCKECGNTLTRELETTEDKKSKSENYIYALITIIGLTFIIIDGLGIILNFLLVPLGLILTLSGLNKLFPKIFKLKAILIGFAAFILVYYLLYILSFTYIQDLSPEGYFTQFLISILISGFMVGYLSGKSYFNGIILGLLMGMIFSIGFTNNIITFIGGFVTLTVFGTTGGLIGVLIYRKKHNYKALD